MQRGTAKKMGKIGGKWEKSKFHADWKVQKIIQNQMHGKNKNIYAVCKQNDNENM